MKNLTWVLLLILLPGLTYAQHVFPIKADSVRIYNVCDTAELIIENRTQDTLGFLFNKGNGRTEFRKLKLKDVGGGKLAIVGQDTINITGIVTRSVDTLWRNGDSIGYRMNNMNYSVFAPMTLGRFSDVLLTSPENGQLLRYNLPLTKWENWTFADTMLGRGGSFRIFVSPFKQAVMGGGAHYDSLGQYSISMGNGMARGASSIAMGWGAKTSLNAQHAIAIASSAEAGADSSIAIGNYAHTFPNASGAVAMGITSFSYSPRSLALGYQTRVHPNSEGATAIGYSAEVTGPYAVALGANAKATGENALAIGDGAKANYSYSTAIGATTVADAEYAVAIGTGAVAKAPGSLAISTYSYGKDTANVTNGFYAAFSGGYELFTDYDFMLKQYSSEKGKVFFRSNKTYTSIGAPITTGNQKSRLYVNGSLALPLKKVSTDYTVTFTDYTVVALSSLVLTLGNEEGLANRTYVLKNASDVSITVNGQSSKKIKRLQSDSATSYTLASGASITVQYDGTDWWIVK